LWQISHHILPTRVFLKNRKVIKEGFCEICKHPEEDLEHRFVHCPINKKTWEIIFSIAPSLRTLDFQKVVDFDFGLAPSLQRGAEILLSEGLYTLWTTRNEVTFGRRKHTSDSAKSLFVGRLKVRLKMEWIHRETDDFANQWETSWWWTKQNNSLQLF
jgi:hypothetical protein